MNRLLAIVRIAPIALAAALLAQSVPAGGPKPPEKPADLDLTVTPATARPGDELRVRVRIEPIPGIKINRYPKIKLAVPDHAGLVGAAEVAIGDDAPPPPDKLTTNYYDTVDPVELSLRLDSGASSGAHELQAKLTYFYCVTASGFCTRARVPLTIPVSVAAD